MINSILQKTSFSLKIKITIKTLISIAFVGLSVLLPQLVHIAFGQTGGIKLLPMYMPVIISSLLLGYKWGLGIGIISPLISFLITNVLLNSPMPSFERLPFMMLELGVISLISGMFAKLVEKNVWYSLIAVLASFVAGRCILILSVAIFQNYVTFTPTLIFNQIISGLIGIAIQMALIPLIVWGIDKLSKSNK